MNEKTVGKIPKRQTVEAGGERMHMIFLEQGPEVAGLYALVDLLELRATLEVEAIVEIAKPKHRATYSTVHTFKECK